MPAASADHSDPFTRVAIDHCQRRRRSSLLPRAAVALADAAELVGDRV